MKTLFENWKKYMLILTEAAPSADQQAAFIASAEHDAAMLFQKAQTEATGDNNLQQVYLKALIKALTDRLSGPM